MIKVSVITVVLNGAPFIAEAIESVLGQDYPHIEHIVVDGGSTDGTADIVRAYGKRVARVISEPDGGIYDAMNKGIRCATGELVATLNADDRYAHPQVISRVVRHLTHANCDTVYGDLVYTQRSDMDQIVRYWKAGNFYKEAFLKGWMPPHPSFFVKKLVYERYGYFNTNIRTAADYELMLRFLHKHQVSTSYLPEVLVQMRMGGASNQSLLSRLKANFEDRLAWKINDLEPHFYTLYAKPLGKLKQYFSKPQKYGAA